MGKPFSAPKVVFGKGGGEAVTPSKRMGKRVRCLKRALEQALQEEAIIQKVSADGPKIKTARLGEVRSIFFENWVTDGDTAEKKYDARRQAFKRACDDAEMGGLIAYRELGGEDFLWFTSELDF